MRVRVNVNTTDATTVVVNVCVFIMNERECPRRRVRQINVGPTHPLPCTRRCSDALALRKHIAAQIGHGLALCVHLRSVASRGQRRCTLRAAVDEHLRPCRWRWRRQAEPRRLPRRGPRLGLSLADGISGRRSECSVTDVRVPTSGFGRAASVLDPLLLPHCQDGGHHHAHRAAAAGTARRL